MNNVKEFRDKKEMYNFIRDVITLNTGDSVVVRVLHTLTPEKFEGVYKVHIYADEICLESDRAVFLLSRFIEALLSQTITAKILR